MFNPLSIKDHALLRTVADTVMLEKILCVVVIVEELAGFILLAIGYLLLRGKFTSI
jgi:hypothetical protein